MQRLFSTFPGSWPGLGLLILRLSVGLFPFIQKLGGSASSVDSIDVATIGYAVPALLFLTGFATPVAGIMLPPIVLLSALDITWPTSVLLLGASSSLVMLGPGAFSLDAKLFGRKRIKLDGI